MEMMKGFAFMFRIAVIPPGVGYIPTLHSIIGL